MDATTPPVKLRNTDIKLRIINRRLLRFEFMKAQILMQNISAWQIAAGCAFLQHTLLIASIGPIFRLLALPRLIQRDSLD